MVAVSVCAALVIYPVFFPKPLSQPAFNLDPAEGKVWINSQVVVDVRGHLSVEEAVNALEFDPPIDLDADDIEVDYTARLPGHEIFPWATTRITINSGRGTLFNADTEYKLEVDGRVAEFETITLPGIVSVQPDPAAPLDNVPTSRDIVILFNEVVKWNDRLLQIEPPTAVTTAVEILPNGSSAVRIRPAARWENSTRYSVRIDGAVEDTYGHEGALAFAKEFVTWARPTVTRASPQGTSQPVESAVQIEFERDVDRAAVQASFRIEPAVAGTFEWQSERLLVWRPQGLQHSAWYRVSVAGTAIGGDLVLPVVWTFRTHDPPVFVDIKGRASAPTVLEAIPSGGLGSYAVQWNTGQTDRKILFPGPGALPHTVEVTVRSGDRTATKALQVAPAPDNGFTPQPCPAGWDLIEVSVCYKAEELPGPMRTFVTRIDLKDPNLQPRSVPAGETLGVARTTGEDARANAAMAAVNGDFFYTADHGTFGLGPMISRGSIVYAPASPEVVLALGSDDSAWVGPASELRFVLQSADGAALGLQGVNHIPEENAASLFNAYWGPELTLETDGCYAVFTPEDTNMRVADYFGCGPLAGIPLPSGAFAIVGRGASAEWMLAQSGNPLGVAHSFPLGAVDFMVSGSHVLIANGAKAAIGPDSRNPRTAIGVDGNGFLYLLVVDGRSDQSLGMTLQELQNHLAQMGITNAINLDGGGSSTMFLRDAVMNHPSDGKERPVANIIEVGPPLPPCPHSFVRC
ncbi:MAG TPA: phosphodiester glycosidase family protein [Dehalococcoidia bacterium]|jgi:hypothetical protein|nr:phosphodiester glycosidase family protein [Dehalococcoidia bacterium]